MSEQQNTPEIQVRSILDQLGVEDPELLKTPPAMTDPDPAYSAPERREKPAPVEREKALTKAEKVVATTIAEAETKAKQSPALKGSFANIQRLLPSAEKVRVWRLNDMGQQVYVADVGVRELESSGDLETHVARWFVPKRGGGTYLATAIDGRGVERQLNALHYPPSDPAQPENEAVRILKSQIEEMKKTMSQPPDPVVDAMRQQMVQKIQKQMSGEGEKSSGGMMDQLMGVMVLKMLNPEQPRTDPAIAALLDKMDRRMEALEKKMAEPPPPPIPPPGPAVDPLETVAKIAAIFKPAPDPNQLGVREILELTHRQSADQPTWRDVIAVITERRNDEKPQQTVLDQIEAVARAKEALERISPPAQPSQNGFFDAVIAVLGGPDIGKGLGDAIKGFASRPQPGTGPVIEDRGRRTAPAPRVDQGATPVGHVPAENPPTRPQIKVPDTIVKLGEELDAASQDLERIDLTVQMLWQADQKIPQQWQLFVRETLGYAANDLKEKTLDNLQLFMSFLVGHQMITRASAIASLRAFDGNWPVVHAGVKAKLEELGIAVPPAAPAANGPAVPPAPTQAAPQPEVVEADDDEEEGEESDEEEDGEGPEIIDLPPDVEAEMARVEPVHG